ncbi:hypothetical protein [Thiocapsa bogorovii]|uniref:hypothetical protein n=1 Tax=Thiocapsa bogorovii TaxID=521689 RepID=UPI001E40440C|nr:hypothetical protein [Thiocapsa bogorovii]UHD15729.1 hypothetical protein LT988_21110 [Thiocapsa bogorovii]
MNESTAHAFLVEHGIDPLAMHPTGVSNWEAFDRFCEEQAKAAGMQPVVTGEFDVTPNGNLARVVRWTQAVQS